MVSVAEATRLIQEQNFRPALQRIKIEEAEGRVLGEEVRADRDFPPFDRVAMDGIAVCYQAIEEGWEGFKVEGLQPAGQPRLTLKNDKNCIEVMTGAMLPIGCDTVIRYEDVTVINEMAKLKTKAITRGQCIHPRAQDAKRGDVILSPGIRISPGEVALLASVGRLQTDVYGYPSVALVSTGDELVDIHDSPKPHQIRRSNTHALSSALHRLACPSQLFHVTDDRNALERDLGKIFSKFEVVILTGGVSKGKFDNVPATLKSLGVEMLFHEVSQRPGKPMLFGITKKQAVFGLPGNPVSSFLCFYRYVRPWLMKGLGQAPPEETAIIDGPLDLKNSELTHFVQVKVRSENGRRMARPIPGGGSGDFANLRDVDGFVEIPQGKLVANAGEVFPYLQFRGAY